MAPDYPGPQALKGSKHAAEWAKSPTLTRANPMSTLTMNTKPLKADDESSNADVDLAIAQDKHLKEAMITHSSSFAKAVSAAVTNTHRLLGLLRQSVKSGDSDTRKKHLEELWDELERLFKASKEAQAAFPQLLEKQNENARLYHGAMAHAAMKETQSELAQQHKKVEIQHSLILDHQQAFMDYQETIKGKLEELAKAKAQITTLQERVSRLTLDKGLYKSEFDKYKRTMDELKAGVSAEAARKLEDELKLSQAAAKKACDEYETLDRAKNDMQNAFEARIADLSDKQGVSRKELEQQRAEYATLQAKFQNQSNEYSGKFAESQKLKAQVASLEKQNADYMTRLNKMKQLETDNTTLAQSKEDLEKRLELLMQTSKDLSKQAEKAKKLEKANEALEIEHDDLSAELSQLKKKLGELDELKAENLKLKESFKNSSGDGSAHEEELQGLQASLDQWKGLAERAYSEYNKVLPQYKKAEELQKQCHEQADEIAKLKEELKAGKMVNGNDLDANYWKAKYETILAQINRR